jgi:hypothetical protein
MARTSFTAVRKALAEHDREALVALVAELYELSAQNRDFLDARFGSDDSALLRYKKIIHEALYPDVMSSDSVSFRAAKKAIADYKKALGDSMGLAELTVYAAECGNQFTCDFGDIDEPFYDSLSRMFESAAKLVSTLEAKDAGPFIIRLGVVVQKADCIGWGYYDSVADIFSELFPDAKGA